MTHRRMSKIWALATARIIGAIVRMESSHTPCVKVDGDRRPVEMDAMDDVVSPVNISGACILGLAAGLTVHPRGTAREVGTADPCTSSGVL